MSPDEDIFKEVKILGRRAKKLEQCTNIVGLTVLFLPVISSLILFITTDLDKII